MPLETDRALADLVDAVRHAQALLDDVLARTEVLSSARSEGRGYADIVSQEQRPLVVEMLTSVLDELARAGSTFRRAEAKALHDAGLSHEAIAALFGVTRQRVGALLQGSTARRAAAAAQG